MFECSADLYNRVVVGRLNALAMYRDYHYTSFGRFDPTDRVTIAEHQSIDKGSRSFPPLFITDNPPSNARHRMNLFKRELTEANVLIHSTIDQR